MSDRLISTVDSLLENHVLHYSCIDSGEQQRLTIPALDNLQWFCCFPGDFEFVSSLVWVVVTCPPSGGYSTLPSGTSVCMDLHNVTIDR